MNNNLSFYTEEESIMFQKQIADLLGYEPPRAVGWLLCLKIYTPPKIKTLTDKNGKTLIGANGKPLTIEMPDSVIEESRWGSAVGLVCSMGPLCYKAERFQGVPWCRVGDWIAYPQHRGTNLLYKGEPFLVLNDDDMLLVVEHPQDVKKN